jgi:hypothetical protein
MTPDELVMLGKTSIICFLVLCAFCAWLHVKSES